MDIGDIGDLPEAGHTFSERVERSEERLAAVERQLDALGDVETAADTKAEKIAAVLSFAMNKRNGQSKVTVSPHESRGCTGVSRRYAYELIDTIGTEIDGVAVREPRQVDTSTGTEYNRKALLVDCDAVHNTKETVNQVTTGDGPTTQS